MKKVFVLSLACTVLAGLAAFADDFDALRDISPAQKQQLTLIKSTYKEQLDSIDNSIMNYNSKIAQVRDDKDKTQEQSALLISAYERNIESLNNQKKQIETEMDNKFKTVMTEEQYKQYCAHQIVVEKAFDNFLQK